MKGVIIMDNVIIYTDGSCSGNPGRGAYAGVILYKDGITSKEIIVQGGYRFTTSNRMELVAVIKSLQDIDSPSNITLYSDSQYVVDTINNGWVYSWENMSWIKGMKIIPNSDLWKKLLHVIRNKGHNVIFKWVKGHNGNVYNEKCDLLAKKFARENIVLKPDTDYETRYIESGFKYIS
jgi:ribonuclease HI